MHLKYVVLDMGLGDAMFIFPDWLEHADVARRLMFGEIDKEKIVSAGFVREGQCRGESISLGVKSHPQEDTYMLKKLWYDD